MLAINKCDYQLSSGDVISIGMNFKALENMTRYPGGLGKLQKDMQRIAINNPEKEGYINPDSEEYGQIITTAISAMGRAISSSSTRFSRSSARQWLR